MCEVDVGYCLDDVTPCWVGFSHPCVDCMQICIYGPKVVRVHFRRAVYPGSDSSSPKSPHYVQSVSETPNKQTCALHNSFLYFLAFETVHFCSG